ncbi:MAG TPA: CdaR family protein [Thermoanaerobaculia bacterium]|nr:CdaR family protein [Thermoanaerobaculia bacterium]
MSERARTWLLRALALAIAVAIWYSVSFAGRETLTERIVEASVSYNRPRGFVILDPVQSVNVRLRGSSKKVRQLNPYQVDVQVELTQQQKGAINVSLSPDDVQVPEGFEVVSIDPDVIRVELDREITQRLPVRPQIVGESAAGATVQDPEAFPNQVLVTGPETLLSRIATLSTRPISLDGHALTFEETVSVLPPDPLIQVVQPSKVTVRVPIEPPAVSNSAGKAQGGH